MICKEAHKWNQEKQCWTPYYKQTFAYETDRIETHYAKWDKAKNSYAPVKEKAIYKICDSGIVAYASYKRTTTQEWEVATEFSQLQPTPLIVEK